MESGHSIFSAAERVPPSWPPIWHAPAADLGRALKNLQLMNLAFQTPTSFRFLKWEGKVETQEQNARHLMAPQSGCLLRGSVGVPQRLCWLLSLRLSALPRRSLSLTLSLPFNLLVGRSAGWLVFFLSCRGEIHIKKLTILK